MISLDLHRPHRWHVARIALGQLELVIPSPLLDVLLPETVLWEPACPSLSRGGCRSVLLVTYAP